VDSSARFWLVGLPPSEIRRQTNELPSTRPQMAATQF